ncbi:beta strand repeat-containing protein [Bdellovibrio sp. HCB-110]|uniref:beta strand repeat-containing protein n=1 Tax=Bdellovibrio sp. HCB-110 TaxID=3391182 RepID=UPI0039B56937
MIYREVSQVNDMRNSNGVFDVPIGPGTKSFPASPTFSLLDAFDNSKTFNCATGGTYTAVDGDKRKLRVQFKDAVGWKLISPDSDIRTVPFAAYSKVAQQLGDKTSADFVLKNSLTTCGANQYLTFDGTNFVCQNDAGASGVVTNVTGTSPISVTMSGSTAQVSLSVGTGAGTVAAGNDSRIAGAFQSSTALGGDLSGTLPNPSVVKIQGKAVSATAPNDGEVLKLNSGVWTPSVLTISDVSSLQTTLDGKVAKSSLVTCDSAQQTLSYNIVTGLFTCRTIDDNSKLPLAGGTMTGAIEMSNNNFTNVGYVTMAAGKNLHLSNNNSDPAGLVAADKGKVWFNSTTNEVKYWDGSTVKTMGVAGSGLQSFNGQTGNAQTLATPGVAGTSPNWSSASDAHTLNIPLASAVGTTAGLISKTDYDNFNNKQTSTLADGKIWVGDASNVATAVTLNGDITTTNAGVTTLGKIQTKPVVITSLASGEILKYNGTNWVNVALGISDITGLSTQLSNKIDAGQMPANCASGQTLTFSSPTGSWVCSSISISDSQITYAAKTANTFLAAPNGSAGAPTFRTIAAADLPANAYDSTYFKNGGNSFGGTASLGTNDNNSLEIKTNNSTRMAIDATGNVGIGTASPLALLHIQSDTTQSVVKIKGAGSATNYATLQLESEEGATDKRWEISHRKGPANVLLFSHYNGASWIDPVAIYPNGNIGIGTISPTGKVHVIGGTEAGIGSNSTILNAGTGADGFSLNTSGSSNTYYAAVIKNPSGNGKGLLVDSGANDNTSGVIANFASNGVSKLLIDEGGNVGIGTSSPTVSLDIGSRKDAVRLPNGTTAEQPASPANGMLRYNTTTNFAEVYQNGAWVSLTTSAGGSNVTTNSSGAVTVAAGGTNQNVTLQASGTGVVTSSSVMTLTGGQASTASNNGALVVSGGVGVSGNINTGGNIYSSGSIASGTSMYSPIIYGGTAAGANLTLDSTSNATKGNIILAPNGGNIGIGSSAPTAPLSVNAGNESQIALLETTGNAGDRRATLAIRNNIATADGSTSGRIIFAATAVPTGGTQSPYWELTTDYGRNGGNNIYLANSTKTGVTTLPFYINGDTGNFGIGTTSPVEKLNVQGKVFITNDPTNYYWTNRLGYLDLFVDDINGSQKSAVNNITYGSTVELKSTSNDGAVHSHYASNITLASNVASGTTNGGTEMGLYLSSHRNGTAGLNDGGTLGNQVGVVVDYGHSDGTVGQTPQTTVSKGIMIAPKIVTGTITNMYDLFLASPETGGTLTNHYSVYQESSTAKNYFAGNVGIGTTSPDGKFHAAMGGTLGDIHFGGPYPDMWFDGGADSYFWISNRGAAGGQTSITYGNTELFTVKNSGKVGVGTTNPAAALDVNGGVRVGSDSSTCDNSKKGTTRYNSTDNIMEYCNGTLWSDFNPPGTHCGYYSSRGSTACRGVIPSATCPSGYTRTQILVDDFAAGASPEYYTCIKN